MFLNDWLRSLRSRLQTAAARHGRTPHRRSDRPHLRPRLEALEDRTVPSTVPLSPGGSAAYGQLPLAFEANQGQASAGVDYLAHGSGYTLTLAADQAVLSLGQGKGGVTLDLQLVGANPAAPAVPSDQLVTTSNYLIGSDPSQWHTDIPNYGQVTYQGVYPGINLVYHGNQGQLEYDFTVAPGANPRLITLAIQGAQRLTLDTHGDLVLHTAAGNIVEQAPVLYQDVGGVQQAVSGRFVLEGHNRVGFRVGTYDHHQSLIIDPTLGYASYLPARGEGIAVDSSGDTYLTGVGWGGSGLYVAKLNATGTALDWVTNLGSSGVGTSLAVDASGDVYVGAYAVTGLPTTPNALATTSSSITDCLSVLTPDGSGLLYSTYLPGTYQQANLGSGVVALAIDHSGDATGSPDNVYLTGTARAGFPTTAGAFQPNFPSADATGRSAFFAEIDPNLSGYASLLYGSYLGGSASTNLGNDGDDEGTGIAIDGSGNAYLTGRTASTNFPLTPGAFQTKFGGGPEDVFVAKFNPALSGMASLVYSTYLGGNGWDGVYTNYPAAGPYTTGEPGPAIAVDSAGDAYVTGTTTSTNFPTTSGAFQTTYHNANYSYQQGDAFVTKLNATGTELVYSTLLGGSDNDGGTAIAVDASGNAYVTGWTRSTNFPTMNPIQAQKAGGVDSQGFANSDAFVATLNSSGTGLLFSTYYGGPGGTFSGKGKKEVFSGSNGDEYGYGLALDAAGNVYVTGANGVANEAGSTTFPTTPGAFQATPGAGFLFKITSPLMPPRQ